MRSNSTENLRKKAIKNTNGSIRKGFLIALPLLLFGTFYLIFQPTNMGINLRTLQPEIVNGAIPIILGLGFVIGSLWGLKNKNRLIENELKRLKTKRKTFSHLQ